MAPLFEEIVASGELEDSPRKTKSIWPIEVQQEALDQLQFIQPPSELFFRVQSRRVREDSAEEKVLALGALTSAKRRRKAVVEIATAALDDNATTVRFAALETLDELAASAQPALEAVTGLTKSKSKKERRAAKQLLKKIKAKYSK